MIDPAYERAIEKLRKYCAYQERCHAEARQKALALGLEGIGVDEAIGLLIQEGFLNEQRFADSWAGGKMRIKKWGPEKIKNMLAYRQIRPAAIAHAIKQYDREQVDRHLNYWFEKKWKEIKGDNLYQRKAKLCRFLLQKGFESHHVSEFVEKKLGN